VKTHLAELFFTDEMRKKYKEIESYKDCEKCEMGIIISIDDICNCSIDTILSLILDVPPRYDINIKLRKGLEKEIKNFNKFLIISGDMRYAKLLAFYLAKKFMKKNRYVVRYVISKGITIMNKEEMLEDISSFNEADVVVFEDIFKGKSNPEYKYELTKRINQNKITIIVGKTDLISIEDDWLEIEIDSNDVEVINETK